MILTLFTEGSIMADEDKKLENVADVEVSDDVDDAQVTDSVSQGENEGIPPEVGIEELKKSLEAQKRAADEERKRRVEAEKRAYEAQLAAQQHESEARNANYHQIVGAISQLEERERGLMSAWTEAKSMGDYQKEAEIQKDMLETANYLSRLRSGRQNMEEQLKRPVQPVAPPVVDPIDAFASTMSKQSGDWLRSHRDFLQDSAGNLIERNRLLLVAAHNKALAEGFKQDDPDYFQYVEQEIGLRKRPSRQEEADDDEDDVVSAAAAPRRSVAPPAAPVSRGGQRKGTFTLTPDEREIAKITGLTEEQYYRNKMRDKKRA
jgi:hypothetical protein